MKRGILFVTMLLLVITAGAKPRSMDELRQAATAVLRHGTSDGALRRQHPPKVLQQQAGLVVMGYSEGGFAILAQDDALPAVLAHSDTRFNPDTDNPGFRWWLSQVEYMAAHPADMPLQPIRPDTSRFAAAVSPMLKTKWDQTSPYNNLCPSYCPTGCVATATAQVLRYHEWPRYGQGKVFTYYPFGDFDGEKLEEDIDGVEYVYENMLNSYNSPRSATSAQRHAVATLMYHVGLAMKAQYLAEGTGSYNEPLCYGLRNHLGYPLAVTVDKDNYTSQEWMDMIFQSLSDGCPLIYGGSDATFTGHEFVLHGYNSSGLIYINWGWGGEEDGYFDLSSLSIYWGIYDFNSYQNMVLRVSPAMLSTDTVSVTVEEPGTLSQLLSHRADSIIALRLSGRINSTDLGTLRSMAGCNVNGVSTMGNLSILDMSDATIVAGGDPYLIEGQQAFSTADDEMPYKAFAGCTKLIRVSLPAQLRHYGLGVFAHCNNLDTVALAPAEESDFVVKECYVLSKDQTELIEGLPSSDVHYCLPQGVRKIHDFAFAGRYLYERITLPETVDSIGKYAFNRCFDLARTYVCSAEPPTIDPTAIDDLDLSLRTLYVPKGSRSKYLSAPGWKKYGHRGIKEFQITDDINASVLETTDMTQETYDLSGKKIGKDDNGSLGLQKGIYIIGGKKRMVR